MDPVFNSKPELDNSDPEIQFNWESELITSW